MKKFRVYFEVYGKKMVTTVEAATSDEAKNAVYQKIIFHDVKCVPETEKDLVNRIEDTLDKIENFLNNSEPKTNFSKN